MATIRERIDASGKKSVHVQVRIKGFPPQTQSFESKTVAKQWAAHVESELRAGRYMPRAEAQRHTVKELLEEYREKILIPRKPKELRSQGPQLDWWINKIGRYSLADLTPVAIANCRDELLQTPFGRNNDRIRAPSTVVRYLAVLSHAFTVAVTEWQWMPESPMSKVKKPKVSNERSRYLSDDEQSRLVDAAKISANRYLYTIVITALSTGMRFGEITNLRWRDVIIVDAEEFGLILLKTTKNGDPRGVPLVDSTYVAIKALRTAHADQHRGQVKDDSPLFPSKKNANKPVEIRQAWETAVRRAKIADFRFHDLRHTAGSYLAMEGATGPQIAEILGHKDLKTSKRYIHFNKAAIAKVMANMSKTRLGSKPDSANQQEEQGGRDDGKKDCR